MEPTLAEHHDTVQLFLTERASRYEDVTDNQLDGDSQAAVESTDPLVPVDMEVVPGEAAATHVVAVPGVTPEQTATLSGGSDAAEPSEGGASVTELEDQPLRVSDGDIEAFDRSSPNQPDNDGTDRCQRRRRRRRR